MPIVRNPWGGRLANPVRVAPIVKRRQPNFVRVRVPASFYYNSTLALFTTLDGPVRGVKMDNFSLPGVLNFPGMPYAMIAQRIRNVNVSDVPVLTQPTGGNAVYKLPVSQPGQPLQKFWYGPRNNFNRVLSGEYMESVRGRGGFTRYGVLLPYDIVEAGTLQDNPLASFSIDGPLVWSIIPNPYGGPIRNVTSGNVFFDLLRVQPASGSNFSTGEVWYSATVVGTFQFSFALRLNIGTAPTMQRVLETISSTFTTICASQSTFTPPLLQWAGNTIEGAERSGGTGPALITPDTPMPGVTQVRFMADQGYIMANMYLGPYTF